MVGSTIGGTATFTDCRISGNSAGGGGGLYNTTLGTLNLTDCTINGNTAKGGGGLVNSGAATLTGCTISGNSAGGGGGLYSTTLGTATFSLIDCTIDANSAGSSGGGLLNHGTATITLTDCTVDGNSASQDGGGLYNDSTPILSLTACTITGNSASGGGGLYTASGTATLTDTIIAGNVAAAGTPSDISDKAASGVTGSYNLVGTGGAGGLAAADHNIIGAANPLLALLGNNGGSTETFALLPGSPAIGAGTAVSGLTTDQRGLPWTRPPDIGSYQVQTVTRSPRPSS